MDAAADQFGELIRGDESTLAVNLDRGVALIAAAMQPGVDVETQIERLDQLAVGAPSEPVELASHLFGPDGFEGNRGEYYDPHNSWLNRVLDRRRGIPITLTIVLMEVGRRLGSTIHGVGMPGHFIAQVADDTYIDAFGGGRALDAVDCEALFHGVAGHHIPFPTGALEITPPRHILRRVLVNLRAIGQRQDDALMNAAVRLLALFPDASPVDLVTLANHYAATGRYSSAATELERAAPLVAESRREALEWQAQRWRARLN